MIIKQLWLFLLGYKHLCAQLLTMNSAEYENARTVEEKTPLAKGNKQAPFTITGIIKNKTTSPKWSCLCYAPHHQTKI